MVSELLFFLSGFTLQLSSTQEKAFSMFPGLAIA